MHLLSSTSSFNSNTSSSNASSSGSGNTCAQRNGGRHRTRSTPHGPLTLHKIARIKMLDRHSCYVAGIQRDIASKEILSKPAFFGQFGEISSIRVLRDRDPGEVYLRFRSEGAAVRAIAWCNSQSCMGISAQHGYQKYCIKFIDNKRCKRPNCPHRHSWCDNRDIIPSATAINAAQQQQPQQMVESIHSTLPLHAATNVETARNGEPDQNNQMVDTNVNRAGMMMLQGQLMELQRQYMASQKWQHWLMTQVQELKEENYRLRTENQFLSLVPGPMPSGAPCADDYQLLIVDGLERVNPHFDEGLVHEIVHDVLAEPLPQNGQ